MISNRTISMIASEMVKKTDIDEEYSTPKVAQKLYELNVEALRQRYPESHTGMKYAYYKADGTSQLIERPDRLNLEELQKLVAGDIEAYQTTDGASVYINEEGRLNDLPKNPFFPEDLRGDVLVTGGVDDEGEDKSLPDDYQLRTLAVLPAQLFVEGNKFTIVWISESLPATVRGEIKMTGGKYHNGNPLFKVRGKRTPSAWRTSNSELMIFEGWDLPFKNDQPNRILMNALYNFSSPEKTELAKFIEEKQINPFFIQKDRINYINADGSEELLFPNQPPSSQRIADLQSAQLKDGKFRIVVGM